MLLYDSTPDACDEKTAPSSQWRLVHTWMCSRTTAKSNASEAGATM